VGEARTTATALARVYPVIALAMIAIVGAALRFSMLGRYAGLPSADHGNYLVAAHDLLGRDVTGYGLEYPPLMFALQLGFLGLADPIMATRIVVVASAAFLPFAFYVAVRRTSRTPWALLAAGLVTFAEAYSEMTGWGGGPDFLALVFMLASFGCFVAYLDGTRRRDLLLAIAFAGLTVWTHQLTALVYAFALVGWAVAELVRTRTPRVLLPFARFGAGAVLVSLPLAPLYLHLSSRLAPQITPLWPDGVDGSLQGLVFVFRDSSALWALFAILASAGFARLLGRGRPEPRFWIAMVAVAFVLALTILRDNAARSLYFLVLPVLAGLPAGLEYVWERMAAELPARDRRIAVPIFLAFLVVSSSAFVGVSVQRMSIAVDWYHAIDVDELEALDWLRGNTPADAVIATSGLPLLVQPEGNRFGWWIEGYAERKSFYTGSAALYTFREQRAMVALANRFFLGNAIEENEALRLVENAPADLRNPSLTLRSSEQDRLLFYFNDGVTFLNYSRAAAPGRNVTFFAYPANETRVTWNTTGAPTIVVGRADTDVSLEREESLRGGDLLVNVTGRVTNGTVGSLTIPLWVGPGLEFVGVQIAGSRVAGTLESALGDSIPFAVTVTAPIGGAVSVRAIDADPVFGTPVLEYVASRAGNASEIRVGFAIDIGSVDLPADAPLDTADAVDIARSQRVTHVFQSRRIYEQLERFLKDRDRFATVFSNEKIEIFEFLG